jgi:uncharacterized membrane protein
MTSNEPLRDDEPRQQHYHDLLGVSLLVFALRTLGIAVIALLVWWLTRLPAPLTALSAIVSTLKPFSGSRCCVAYMSDANVAKSASSSLAKSSRFAATAFVLPSSDKRMCKMTD